MELRLLGIVHDSDFNRSIGRIKSDVLAPFKDHLRDLIWCDVQIQDRFVNTLGWGNKVSNSNSKYDSRNDR